MSGNPGLTLFETVRRDAVGRLAEVVRELLPALSRRLGRLAITAVDLPVEQRLDGAARRFEFEIAERVDRSLATFAELHYRMLREEPVRQPRVVGGAGEGRIVGKPAPIQLLTDEELSEEVLAIGLATSARHLLEGAYPSYLARIGLMLGNDIDEDDSALTAKGFARAMVASLRPFAAEPLLREPLGDSLRLLGASALAGLIESVDASLIAAGLLVDAPRIVLERSNDRRSQPVEPTATDIAARETEAAPGAAGPAANAAAYDHGDAEATGQAGAAPAMEGSGRAALPPATDERAADESPSDAASSAASDSDLAAATPQPPEDADLGELLEVIDTDDGTSLDLGAEDAAAIDPSVAGSPVIAHAVSTVLGGARGARMLGVHPITGKRHPKSAFRQAELLPRVESLEQDAIRFAHEVGAAPFSHDARTRFFGVLRDSMRSAKIDDAQMATLDLVQAMFDYVNDDGRIPEQAKPLLWRLQMPSVTLACLDPGYLASDDRSMRSLVEHVAAISVAYPDDMSRDSELYRRLQTLVRAAEVVAHAFQVRSRVLSERVAIEYSRATYGMGQLVSRAHRERRELEATAGQINRRDYRSRPSREREAQVTERMNALMSERVAGRNVPDSVRDFLGDVWVRHLRTQILRDGEDSAAFQVALAVVDDLLWTLDGAGERRSRRLLAEKIPRILQTLTQGIGDIGARPEDFGPFFDEMFLIHLRRMQRRKSRRPHGEGRKSRGAAGGHGRAHDATAATAATDEPATSSSRARSFESSRWPSEDGPATIAANDLRGADDAARDAGHQAGKDLALPRQPRRAFDDAGFPILSDPFADGAPAAASGEPPDPVAAPQGQAAAGGFEGRPSAAGEAADLGKLGDASVARSEEKLRRLIQETGLDDAPVSPARVRISPQQLQAQLAPGDWLELLSSSRKVVLAKVAWINERRTVALLLQHPDRLVLTRHLAAIADRARRGRAFLVR